MIPVISIVLLISSLSLSRSLANTRPSVSPYVSYSLKKCGTLPSPRIGASAVYDGQGDFVYILGGIGQDASSGKLEAIDEVLRFNIGTGQVEIIGRFPTPMGHGAGVFDKFTSKIYYFGPEYVNGRVEGDHSVWEIPPNSNPIKIDTVAQYLKWASVVSDDVGSILLVGGSRGNNSLTDQINRFNSTTGKFRILGRMPAPPGRMCLASAVWANESMYTFGGAFPGSTPGSLSTSYANRFYQIQQNGGAGATADRLEDIIRDFITASAAVLVENSVYIIGGRSGDDTMRHLIRFNITGHTVDYLLEAEGSNEELSLPTFHSAVYVPKKKIIYLFGGWDESDKQLDSIYCLEIVETKTDDDDDDDGDDDDDNSSINIRSGASVVLFVTILLAYF